MIKRIWPALPALILLAGCAGAGSGLSTSPSPEPAPSAAVLPEPTPSAAVPSSSPVQETEAAEDVFDMLPLK